MAKQKRRTSTKQVEVKAQWVGGLRRFQGPRWSWIVLTVTHSGLRPKGVGHAITRRVLIRSELPKSSVHFNSKEEKKTNTST